MKLTDPAQRTKEEKKIKEVKNLHMYKMSRQMLIDNVTEVPWGRIKK